MKAALSEHSRPGTKVGVCWLLLGGCLFAVWRLERMIDSRRAALPQVHQNIYFTSGKTLRQVSGGYSGLLADIYWTRAVQYFGRRRLAHAGSFPLLGELLDITTDLDPHLLVAYRFGSIFLAEKRPDGAGKPEEALRLVRKGIVANPDYWRFWEDLGFIYYMDLKDYQQAARAFETGSRQPGAYIWMGAMAATVAAKGGDLSVSKTLWSEVYKTAETKDVRNSALAHLAALDAAQQLKDLDTLLAEYSRREGRLARSFQDLVSAGLLRGVPRDPTGVPYIIGSDGTAALSPQSKIERSLLP